MNKIFRKKLNKKGFTLIELIVVIAILGILAAIAIPRLSIFSDQATEKAGEASAKSLTAAAAIYFAENDEWPTISDIWGNVEVGEQFTEDDFTIDADGIVSYTPTSP